MKWFQSTGLAELMDSEIETFERVREIILWGRSTTAWSARSMRYRISPTRLRRFALEVCLTFPPPYSDHHRGVDLRFHQRRSRLRQRHRYRGFDQGAEPSDCRHHGSHPQPDRGVFRDKGRQHARIGHCPPRYCRKLPALVLAALIGAIGWNLFTWHFGIPSSSSMR